jgi:hypothetical protein
MLFRMVDTFYLFKHFLMLIFKKFHETFQIFTVKLKNTTFCHESENISTPFERASNFGTETIFR